METTMTVQDLFNIFLAFCGAIAAIGAATAVIARWIAKAKAPEGFRTLALKPWRNGYLKSSACLIMIINVSQKQKEACDVLSKEWLPC